jgi:hypothetical protein
MKSTISLISLGGALALSSEKVDFVAQQPLIQNACPLNSLLHKGECQLPKFESPIASTLTFQSNASSHISHFTQTLKESRALASQTKDFPWTFWPECFSNEETPEPYCVFSDQTFASGRGIFIITTQTFAYAMLEKEAFKRPDSLFRANNYANPPFYQHDFPGKGRGLVANKTLQRGDQIFASTPILITDPDLYNLAEPERLALLHRGVETLPPASQDRFWELMGRTDGELDSIDDRITTNNFEVNIDDVSQSALFPEIAMLNHDCRPNAAYFFDEKTMSHYIHAIRPIHPGEEITITYVNNESSRETRVRRLEKHWGFKCACSSCTAHPTLISESDSRLSQIVSLQESLNDWTPTSSATPAIAELLVSLYKQERLDASLATAYQHAAEVYASFGMKWEAVRYARLSVEMSILDKGFGDRDVKDMRKMAKEPEMTWSWGKRVGMKSGGCGCGKNH